MFKVARQVNEEEVSIEQLIIELRALFDTFGKYHPMVAEHYQRMADKYFQQGHYNETEKCLKEALIIVGCTVGESHIGYGVLCDGLSQFYIKFNRLDEAKKYSEKALLIAKGQLKPSHYYNSIFLKNFALILRESGRLDEAEPFARTALENALLPENKDLQDICPYLVDLGVILRKKGKFTEAVKLFQQALEISELSYGLGHPETAFYLYNYAGLCREVGRYKEAEGAYRKAIKIVESSKGPDLKTLFQYYNAIGVLLNDVSKYDEAEQYHRRALFLVETSSEATPLDIALCLDNLASVLNSTNNFSDAKLLRHRALELISNIDSPDTAIALCNFANQFSHEEAFTLLERAREIFEKTLGTHHYRTGLCLEQLASVHSATGQYDESSQLYQQALRILKESELGPDNIHVASCLGSMAGFFCEIGQFDKAKPLYLGAIDIIKRTKGHDHPDVGSYLLHLSSMLKKMDRYEDACSLLFEAYSIFEKSSDVNSLEMARYFYSLGEMCRESEQYDKAEHCYKIALEIKASIFGIDHPNLVGCFLGRARLLHATNRADVAENCCRHALIICEQWGVTPRLPDVLYDLSFLLLTPQRRPGAILLTKRAVNLLQGMRQQVAKIDDRSRTSFDASINHIYRKLTELLIESGRFYEAEYVMGMLKEKEQTELERGDQPSDLCKQQIEYNDAEKPIMQFFENIGRTLSDVHLQMQKLESNFEMPISENPEYQRLQKDLQQVKNVYFQFLGSFTNQLESAPISKGDSDEGMTIDPTQLDQETVAITTVCGEDEFSVILTSSAQKRKTFKCSCGAVELGKKVLEFRKNLLSYDPDNPKPPTDLAHKLYTIIFAPMEQELRQNGFKTILWRLDGVLRLLPLGALHDGESYLVEKYRMVCTTTLSKVGKQPHRNWTGLGLGVTEEHEGHDALPEVKSELEGIIHGEDTKGILPGKILLDKAFTRESMQSSLNGDYQAVHIASHFELNPCRETLSYLLLGDGTHLRLDELRTMPNIFKDVDLLAFSACSTGINPSSSNGREMDGIGYLGERHGASTVIATLWPVVDKSTSLLMREFYQLRKSGLTKAKSLQKAQIALLKGELEPESDNCEHFTHPYFWAPFVLIGNAY